MRLIFGDCTEKLYEIPAHSVDMVFADTPYGTTSCKWDSIIPLEKLWPALEYCCKSTAAILLTASQPYTSVLVLSNVARFRHEWIWIKNRGSNFANTVREPMKEHESVLMFSKGKWTYNKQMQERTGAGLERTQYNCDFLSKSENYRNFEGRIKNKLTEKRVPSSWQKFNVVCGKEKHGHPTQKPVPLAEYFIRTYSNKGDTVLDFCMGVGTTGIACANIGRDFIGIEKDKKYYTTAKRYIMKTHRRA